MNRFADVVIIGAGAIGASAAFHLARGTRTRQAIHSSRIVVVEKGSVASGMTKRSGGLVHATMPTEIEMRLAHASLPYFADWKNTVGGECVFTKTGLVVTADEARTRDLAAMLQRIGVNAQILTPSELQTLQPGTNVDDLASAIFEPDAGYLDPIQATQSFAARAKELGVEFRTGTLVKSIRVDHGRVVGLETTTGDIETLSVIVATSAWSGRLLKSLNVELGVRASRTQVAFFDRPAELKKGHVAFADFTTGAYFRPHTFGMMYAGTMLAESDAANPDHFDETVSQTFVADLRERIAKRLPAMANARFVRGHTGVYDVTENANPIIGKVPGIAGLVVAAGFGGNGFALAPAVGACLAEIAIEGTASTVNLGG